MKRGLFLLDAEIPSGSEEYERYWIQEARATLKKWAIITDEEVTEGRRRFTVAGDVRRVVDASLELQRTLATVNRVIKLAEKVKLPWVRYREKLWKLRVDRFENGAVDVWIGPWVWTNEWDAYLQRLEDEDEGDET